MLVRLVADKIFRVNIKIGIIK